MNFADILASCMRLCAAARLGKEAERSHSIYKAQNGSIWPFSETSIDLAQK